MGMAMGMDGHGHGHGHWSGHGCVWKLLGRLSHCVRLECARIAYGVDEGLLAYIWRCAMNWLPLPNPRQTALNTPFVVMTRQVMSHDIHNSQGRLEDGTFKRST